MDFLQVSDAELSAIKLSPVVKKNLERAFSRSTNKRDWFEKLRRLGVSQEFYEYVLADISLPLEWVVSDLMERRLTATPQVRQFLKSKLAVNVPGDDPSENILRNALGFLTPVEVQEALVARYTIGEIPTHIINREVVNLLWDAKNHVSSETASRWAASITNALINKDQLTLLERSWIEFGWTISSHVREIATPRTFPGENLDWSILLQAYAEHHSADLLYRALIDLDQDRLKYIWIEQGHDLLSDEQRDSIIASIKNEASRLSFEIKACWRKGKIDDALRLYPTFFDESSVVNETLSVARDLISRINTQNLYETEAARIAFNSAVAMIDQFTKKDHVRSAEIVSIVDCLIGFGQLEEAYSRALYFWNQLTEPSISLEKIFQLSDLCSRHEETQKHFVEQIIKTKEAGPVQVDMIEALLHEGSPYRLKHLRDEFVERATAIHPLHPELLKHRSSNDSRSTIVYRCFFGSLDLDKREVKIKRKRRFYFWRTAQTVFRRPPFVRAFTSALPADAIENVDYSKKLFRVQKLFGVKDRFAVLLSDQLERPFQVDLRENQICLSSNAKYLLDPEIFEAICFGVSQAQSDFKAGLFEPDVLAERFFLGLLLAGIPFAKIVRLLLELARAQAIFDDSILDLNPQELTAQFPFLKSFIAFYLSKEYLSFADECGIPIC